MPDDTPKPGPARRGRRLKNLHLDRVDLVHAPANPPAKVKLFKQDGEERANNTAPDTLEGMMSLDKSKLSDAVRKHLEELETSDPDAAAALTEALAATQAETPAQTVVADEVAKSEFAQLQKQLEDAKAEAAATAQEIAKMKAEAKLAGFVALAKADLEPLGKADEVGDLLLIASEAMPVEKYQALERLLKGAAAQLATGEVFKQKANTTAEPTDAEAKLDELAKEALKAGVAKTIELAKLQVIQTNPDLYREITAARADG